MGLTKSEYETAQALTRARLKCLGDKLDRSFATDCGFTETTDEMERRLCPDRFFGELPRESIALIGPRPGEAFTNRWDLERGGVALFVFGGGVLVGAMCAAALLGGR